MVNIFLFIHLYWKRKFLTYTVHNELPFHTVIRTVLPQYDAQEVQMPCFYEILTLCSHFSIELNTW
jgi:hypothetical protein